jgi:hypothetical protein
VIGPLCWPSQLAANTAGGSERKRQCLRPENSCFRLRLLSASRLRSPQVLLSPTHLEALTSNVTAANRRLLDAYRMNGSCEAGSPAAAPWPRPPWLVNTRMVRGHWPDRTASMTSLFGVKERTIPSCEMTCEEIDLRQGDDIDLLVEVSDQALEVACGGLMQGSQTLAFGSYCFTCRPYLHRG